MLIPLSTLVLLIIVFGLVKKNQMQWHIPAMSLAFALDVALVLYIEFTRHAIGSTIEGVTTPQEHTFLLFHVSVSLATILLYVTQFVTGYKLLRGNHGIRKLHRNLAAVFLLCRLINYVTSFWMPSVV